MLNNSIFLPKRVIKLCISYTLDPWSRYLNTDFTLNNCLFGSVKLTNNADPDKYKYSGCSIGYDSCSEFSSIESSMGKNVIIFGVDMSLFLHVDNKKTYLKDQHKDYINSRRWIS